MLLHFETHASKVIDVKNRDQILHFLSPNKG